MKLLHIKVSNFKKYKEEYEIDFVYKTKKTIEDINNNELELQKVADGLYVYNTIAFIGDTASGKTTLMELLDMCCSILGEFRLENKNYLYDNVDLTMDFYYEGYIYRYKAILKNNNHLQQKAIFTNQKIYKKKYDKTKIQDIYNEIDFDLVEVPCELPDDISDIFFVLKKEKTRAIYFDSYEKGEDTYKLIFEILRKYNISSDILKDIISIFDKSIIDLRQINGYNYILKSKEKEEMFTSKELFYRLSKKTTRGILLYIYIIVSLKNGFNLIIDDIENNFDNILINDITNIYKNKYINKYNATLIFTTNNYNLYNITDFCKII